MAGLREGDAAGHRRAGVRAVLAGQAVDVEADVDVLRKRGDDLLAHLGPGGARELAVAQALVVEGPHAALRPRGELHLARAHVADAHLHQPLHAREPRHHVVEDARVAPREALEGVAQVGVRVDLQDAHAGVAHRELGDQAEGARVVAAEHGGDRAAVEDALGLARDVAVHALAGGVHGGDRPRVRLVAGDRAARRDDRFRGRARALRERGDVLGDRQHRDARLPHGPVLDVLEVDLLARLQDVRRAARRAGAVAGGGVERHRDHDHLRLPGARVEAEEPVARGGGVGVEAGGDDGGGTGGGLAGLRGVVAARHGGRRIGGGHACPPRAGAGELPLTPCAAPRSSPQHCSSPPCPPPPAPRKACGSRTPSPPRT